MRLRIHRGTQEIGGTCVELEAEGERILLDIGLPLNTKSIDEVPLPDVLGLTIPDASLKGIILSHGHRDHWGLLPRVTTRVPVFLGAATERIMRAAADFVPDATAPCASQHLVDKQPIQVGPFKITPYLVDHSGFDAYALLVEAGGKKLFYSGDLRAHGRKGALFERLLRDPPKDVDVMLMEGSSLGRIGDDERFQTEDELEEEFLDRLKSTPGLVVVACSAQNIDRVVTVYRAAKRGSRKLLVDAYAAEVLIATGNPRIPKPADDWHDVKVWIPQSQRVSLKRKGIASIVDAYKGRRVWPQNLPTEAQSSVLIGRAWMLDELEMLGALQGARVIWSQWDGYLRDGVGAELALRCQRAGIPFEVLHTSGHASPPDLKRLALGLAPRRVVPIHTFARDKYAALFENVCLVDDLEWVEV